MEGVHQYKSSLDMVSIIITCLVFALFIFGIILSLLFQPWFGGLVLSVTVLLIIIPTYLCGSVKSYIVNDIKIVIERPLRRFNRVILLSDISSVRIGTNEDFKQTIRVSASGGLFGYFGAFSNKKLGRFNMYSGNVKNRIILILTNNKGLIVLSPNDKSMFDFLQDRIR